VDFLAISGYKIHFKSGLRRNQLRLKGTSCIIMKISALNVDFDGLSFDFLSSRKPAHKGNKEWYPKKVVILPLLASLS